MKRSSKVIISSCLAFLLVVIIAISTIATSKTANAQSIDLTYYSNQVLFIPPNAIDKVNFYAKTTSSTTNGVNLGTLYIYSRYPYQPTIQSTIYSRRLSTTNYNQNGLVYTGGGNFNYLTYTAGNYRVNNYVVDPYYPPLYLVIEFNDFSNTSSDVLLNTFVSTPSDLFSNGCMFLDSGPSKQDDYLYYAFLGGYLSNKDNQESYERGIDEVIKNHNDYGLYNENELQIEIQKSYNAGLNQGNSTFNTFSNVLSTAWNSATSFLSIPVFGNMTILHLILLPLTLGILIIIIKLLRG